MVSCPECVLKMERLTINKRTSVSAVLEDLFLTPLKDTIQ